MKKIALSFLIIASLQKAYSQGNADCINSIVLCTNPSFNSDTINGNFNVNNISNPNVNPSGNLGCMLAGELSPQWLLLTIGNAGLLEFVFGNPNGPNPQAGFYDWAMWPYTPTTCNQIINNTLPPVRCNWNGALNNGTGLASPANFAVFNGFQANFEAPLAVNACDQFVICISNFSQVNTLVSFQNLGTASLVCSPNCNPSYAICAGLSATVAPPNIANLTNPTYSIIPGGFSNTTGSFVVSPNITTSYTTYITGTNNSGAVQTTTGVSTVTVNTQPLISPVIVQSSCTNTLSSVNLGLTFNPLAPIPGYTVTWLPVAPNGITSNTQTALSGVINPGTYTANIVAAGGCATSTVITINPTPPTPSFTIVNSSGSASITCATPSIVLNALTNYTFGTLTYFWSSNTFTSSAPSVTVTAPSTLITLQVVDLVTNCAATRTTVIFQNTVVPTCSATPLNQVVSCGQGIVATVTATAISPTVNVSFSLLSPNAPVPFISGGQTVIFNPVVGMSTLTCINNVNGCKSINIPINVTSLSGFPTFNVTSAGNFTLGCSTKSLTDITIVNPNTVFPPGGGAISFTILPPSFTGSTYTYNTILTQTFNVPGNYTVIVRDNSNQCETRITVPLIQNITPPQLLVNTITRTLTCFTPSVTLEGSSSTNLVAYNWSFQNGSNPNNIPNPIIVVTASLNQTALTQSIINTYTLTITNTDNLCTSNTVITMAQNVRPPLPIINNTGSLTCLINKFNLTNGSSINPAPGFFSPLGTQATLWQGPSPQMDLINSSFYEGLTAGIYTMTVMDLNNGCKTQTTTVIGDSRNYPVLSSNTLVALDCGANLTGVTLSVTALNLKASDVTPKWLTPNPTPNIKGQNTMTLTTDGIGDYRLSVTTNSNGCSSSIQIKVINGVLNGSFSADQVSGYAPLTVNFTNLSSSTSSISGTSSITTVWSFGNGTTKTTTNNISTSALFTQPGNYTVTMYASKGTCLDTSFKVIVVDIPSKLDVPNVFTPNGDNSNDVFFVKSANLTEITALIYDRWGNKVYELTTDKGNIAWDGKTQAGKEAADGTYFYVITAKGRDGQSYDTKGTLSLMR
jgi:gliding motility-associated-like protein